MVSIQAFIRGSWRTGALGIRKSQHSPALKPAQLCLVVRDINMLLVVTDDERTEDMMWKELDKVDLVIHNTTQCTHYLLHAEGTLFFKYTWEHLPKLTIFCWVKN